MKLTCLISLAPPSPGLSFLTCEMAKLLVSKVPSTSTFREAKNFPESCPLKSSSFCPAYFLLSHRAFLLSPLVTESKGHRTSELKNPTGSDSGLRGPTEVK